MDLGTVKGEKEAVRTRGATQGDLASAMGARARAAAGVHEPLCTAGGEESMRPQAMTLQPVDRHRRSGAAPRERTRPCSQLRPIRHGPKPSATARGAETSRPDALCVLVVDDEPMVRRTIAELLARQGGYAVREAGTYRDARRCSRPWTRWPPTGTTPTMRAKPPGPGARTRPTRPWARQAGRPGVCRSRPRRAGPLEGFRHLKKPIGILGLVAALAKTGSPTPETPPSGSPRIEGARPINRRLFKSGDEQRRPSPAERNRRGPSREAVEKLRATWRAEASADL